MLIGFMGMVGMLTACAPPRSSHIVIGAKDFTEQVVLGELLAQEIEASGGGPVERRFWLAGRRWFRGASMAMSSTPARR
jgi:glycine betaine/choline ABC-type transport system substrate-binding protein